MGMTKYQALSLGRIIDSGANRELLEQRLKEFRCERDEQLARFIHNQAAVYEKKGVW
jgi:hypothetical protein